MIFFLLENLHLWEERRCERSFYRCFLICRLWVRRFYTQKRWVIVFQGAENRPEHYGYFKKRLAGKRVTYTSVDNLANVISFSFLYRLSSLDTTSILDFFIHHSVWCAIYSRKFKACVYQKFKQKKEVSIVLNLICQ